MLPSFSDYISSRENNSHLFGEMPLPATSFKNSKGEFEGEYHVSSNAPVFMDKYDVYYLYQFPRKFWAEAMYARYNRFLHDAKTQPNFNNIQDVTLIGHGGVKITFKRRNTFAKELVDKIERTVDVNHFRQSNKTSDEQQKYKDSFHKNKEAGVDMGGMIGATLADPIYHKVKVGKNTNKGVAEKDKDLLMFRGMVAPNKDVLRGTISSWMKGSSEGWLRDLSKVSHERKKVNAGGGKGGGQEYATFTGTTLQAVQQEMAKAGAVPFIATSNHLCKWPNVAISTKKGTVDLAHFGGDLKRPEDGSPLPVLFPGLEVHSEDIKAHEADQEFLKKLQHMKSKDLEQIKYDLSSQVKKLERELEERDLANNWETDDPSESKEREAIVEKLISLKNMNDYRNWFRQTFQNTEMTPENIEKSVSQYANVMKEKMNQRLNTARKYNAYDWNVHRFNRTRHDHDPLNVGMGNPTQFGRRKFESISRGKTTGMGTVWPNRQSRSMIHGPKGQWEDELKDYFGHGYNPSSDSFNLKSPLSGEDAHHLERDAKAYVGKIAEKLANDPDVVKALGITPANKQQTMAALSDLYSYKQLLQEKFPNLKFKRGEPTDENLPEILRMAYSELALTENNLKKVREEAASGQSSNSAIADGVDKFLNSSQLASTPDVQAAMQPMRVQLIQNAENFVRRTIGDSPFVHYLDNRDKGVKGTDKYKQVLDLKSFIRDRSYNYAAQIAQLDFGGTGTRRERERNRKTRGKGQTFSLDAAVGDAGAFSANTSSDDLYRRIDNKFLDSIIGDPRLIGDFGSNLFADKEGRNKYRRTRASSDVSADKIGHSIESMYDLLDVAKKKASSSLEDLQTKNRATPTSGEVDMINQISGAAAYFHLFKALFMRSALLQGQTANEKEANRYAKQKTIEQLKKDKFLPTDYKGEKNSQTTDQLAQNFRNRVDDDAELDSDEKEVAGIISRWDDEHLNKGQIDLKLNDITVLAKNSNNLRQRRIVDLLLMYYGKQPQMGAFDDDKMAASATGEILPDVDLPAEKLAKVRAAIAKVHNSMNRIQQSNQANQVNPANMQRPVVPVQQPVPALKPTGSPLARFIRKPS